MNYIQFKNKLSERMKKEHLEFCDLIPIDWNHLYKHCSISYILMMLTWKAVRERCKKTGAICRQDAPDELNQSFKEIEKTKTVDYSYPMLDYTLYVKANGIWYKVCAMPVKTDHTGETKFFITHYKELSK